MLYIHIFTSSFVQHPHARENQREREENGINNVLSNSLGHCLSFKFCFALFSAPGSVGALRAQPFLEVRDDFFAAMHKQCTFVYVRIYHIMYGQTGSTFDRIASVVDIRTRIVPTSAASW